ncbi:MAG: alcohol dehydrogenase [Phycisphaeraceae bacterium]|nr:alcohol dehydrogenase [Phycisphaeraceae bacterium]
MKALVLLGKQLILDNNFPDPKPQEDEAIIRPLLMGVCSTDLELCKGYMDYNGVLGHEFVGIVEDVANKKKNKHWIGKRVVGTINCVCGECDMCQRGLQEHCRDRTVLGIQNRHGCFAEYFSLPVRNLIEVPETVDNDNAVFTEPLAAAFQILRQLTVEGRPFVTVLGDGRLGLLCAQVLTQLNGTVRLLGKHPEKMERCEKWGVKHRLVSEVGLRADQDIVVDCTGSSEGLELAMQMVRPRGKLVLKTTVADKRPMNLAPIVINEIEVIGSRCGPFPEALSALRSNTVDVVSLISRRMKLSDGPDILRAAKQPGVIKVLVEP